MLGTHRSAPLLLLFVALASPLATRGEEVRIGGEFQVNSYTSALQRPYSVAVEADGDFIVVWVSNGQDGDAFGVFGRRFASSGAALGQEFQLSLFTGGSETQPSVAVHDTGFVVAWASTTQDSGTGGIYARRFTSGGAGIGGEFRVNVYTPGSQARPSVAAEANGDFVVVWESEDQDGDQNGVFARRFSSAGTGLGVEFQVPLHSVGFQNHHAIASDADGDFIIVWDSSDGDAFGVFARRFSSAGGLVGTQFLVNTYTVGFQEEPSVAIEADGDFVISFDSARDGSDLGVFFRRFVSNGVAVTGEVQVNTYTTGHQRVSTVSAEPNGDFMVVWTGPGPGDGGGYGISGRQFSSSGQPLTADFQVNTYTVGSQGFPVMAVGDGRFVVVWGSSGQDGSSYGAFAQRFAGPIALDIDGNGAADALTDGILSLRYLFGFRGPTLVDGAVDLAGCSRCDAVAIEGYLSGLAS